MDFGDSAIETQLQLLPRGGAGEISRRPRGSAPRRLRFFCPVRLVISSSRARHSTSRVVVQRLRLMSDSVAKVPSALRVPALSAVLCLALEAGLSGVLDLEAENRLDFGADGFHHAGHPLVTDQSGMEDPRRG